MQLPRNSKSKTNLLNGFQIQIGPDPHPHTRPPTPVRPVHPSRVKKNVCLGAPHPVRETTTWEPESDTDVRNVREGHEKKNVSRKHQNIMTTIYSWYCQSGFENDKWSKSQTQSNGCSSSHKLLKFFSQRSLYSEITTFSSQAILYFRINTLQSSSILRFDSRDHNDIIMTS